MKRWLILLGLALLDTIVLGEAVPAKSQHPIRIADGLLHMDFPDTLGLGVLPDVRTVTVYAPGAEQYAYNHGAVLFGFKGVLYVQWQSSRRDEDAPETRVMYSRSQDGVTWSEPRVLAESDDRELITNGGWWSAGNRLIAYLCVWPKGLQPKGGIMRYIESEDGENWSDPQPVMKKNGCPLDGILEQDLRCLPGGRILTAVHEQPGLILSPYYTDDLSGCRGWTAGQMVNLFHEGQVSRELEPSWFYRPPNEIVMVFRDQGASYRKLASVSSDNGATWTTPAVTNIPDSRSKQSAGNLPDGTAFLVGSPTGSKQRYPLVIMLSKDGLVFDRAFLLRAGADDPPPMRFAGRFKRAGFSYPKSLVWQNNLYVSYATNKEDIQVTRIPLSALE